jgi:hypothetical protein
MTETLRIEYGGAIYHVMNRRDRREAIFRDDRGREMSLETFGTAERGSAEGADRTTIAGGDADDLAMDS